MILNPYNMEIEDWADAMNLFSDVGNSTSQKLIDEDNWQDWAVNLVGDPDEVGRDAPDPYDFDDWREWAAAFFLTQELV